MKWQIPQGKWHLPQGMKWGLSQGIMGKKLATLTPSATAVGPNTYLQEQDFLKMLGIAGGVHALVFLIASFFPHEQVTRIPVRALTFKLGDSDRIAAFGSSSGVGISMNTAPPAPTITAEWRATAHPAPTVPAPLQPINRTKPASQPTPRPVKTQKVIPVTEPAARQMPVENLPTQTLQPLPQILPQAQPAIAPNPQQYVRETGAAPNTGYGSANGALGGQGTENTMTAQTMQQIRERYELQISSWIERHKFYPPEAAGREGRTVVRMRIDRTGYVRYYAIEQSSGIAAIDAAAIDMIRRANPVPNVPENYPAGQLIEFLIPITFRAPR